MPPAPRDYDIHPRLRADSKEGPWNIDLSQNWVEFSKKVEGMVAPEDLAAPVRTCPPDSSTPQLRFIRFQHQKFGDVYIPLITSPGTPYQYPTIKEFLTAMFNALHIRMGWKYTDLHVWAVCRFTTDPNTPREPIVVDRLLGHTVFCGIESMKHSEDVQLSPTVTVKGDVWTAKVEFCSGYAKVRA